MEQWHFGITSSASRETSHQPVLQTSNLTSFCSCLLNTFQRSWPPKIHFSTKTQKLLSQNTNQLPKGQSTPIFMLNNKVDLTVRTLTQNWAESSCCVSVVGGRKNFNLSFFYQESSRRNGVTPMSRLLRWQDRIFLKEVCGVRFENRQFRPCCVSMSIP